MGNLTCAVQIKETLIPLRNLDPVGRGRLMQIYVLKLYNYKRENCNYQNNDNNCTFIERISRTQYIYIPSFHWGRFPMNSHNTAKSEALLSSPF